jgi:hypothetical protein
VRDSRRCAGFGVPVNAAGSSRISIPTPGVGSGRAGEGGAESFSWCRPRAIHSQEPYGFLPKCGPASAEAKAGPGRCLEWRSEQVVAEIAHDFGSRISLAIWPRPLRFIVTLMIWGGGTRSRFWKRLRMAACLWARTTLSTALPMQPRRKLSLSLKTMQQGLPRAP